MFSQRPQGSPADSVLAEHSVPHAHHGLLSDDSSLNRLSAIAALHSMQPMPAVRQPSADHFSVSGGENSLCQSYTGHTSGFPGSLRRLRAGSVTMTLVLARMSASLSLSMMALP